MKTRCGLAICMIALAVAAISPALAAHKTHHHTASAGVAKHSFASAHNSAAKKHALALHLQRLAAKEKHAWRKHLAKIRALPKVKRIAVLRHDRKFKKFVVVRHIQQVQHLARLNQHMKRLAAIQAHNRLAAQHRARLAARQHAKHRSLTAAKPAATRSARLHSAHLHRLALIQQVRSAKAARTHHLLALRFAHLKNLKLARAANERASASRTHRLAAARAAHVNKAQSLHIARLRAHQFRMSQALLNHNARLANRLAGHAARVALNRSRWEALHGANASGGNIKLWETEIDNVPVKTITVDLNDPNVKISAEMARRGNGTSEPFRQMIQRANPNAAVTGTFFSLDNLQPVGDIVIDGSLVHFGGMGTALCITPDNHADMVTCQWGRHHDWSQYDFVVACGPRLLHRGRVVLDPKAEKFRDHHMLARNSRIAVGITPGNKIVFAMTREPIYLGKLAKVMQGLGAYEAMNLDAGTSSGFYFNGITLARPGRNLTNMIVVYSAKNRYERALNQLVPSAYHRAYAHVRGSRISLADR